MNYVRVTASTLVCVAVVVVGARTFQSADTPRCKLKKVRDDVFLLELGSWSAQIETLERDARLVRSKLWPNVPHLLVAEIDLGTAGSYIKVREVDLFVFDLRRTNTVPVLKQQIGRTGSFWNPKTERRETMVCGAEPYRLEETQGRKPRIRWLKSAASKVLDVNK